MTGRQRTRLTDSDLVVIATAPLGTTAAELARQLGRPYFTVAKAVQRIRDGWVCRLTWTTCTECGQPLATGLERPRTVHPRCVTARWARYSRERRRAGKNLSTPYVRSWRQRHPEANAALREREKAQQREQWHDLPLERQLADLDHLHAADDRDYPITLAQVSRSGAVWTPTEDQFILEHPRMPAREIGLRLGRTLWAVRGRRVLLRKRGSAAD